MTQAIREQSLYVEECLIKTILLHPHLLPQASQWVSKETFRFGINRVIWEHLEEIIAPEIGKSKTILGGSAILPMLCARLKGLGNKESANAAQRILNTAASASHRIGQIAQEVSEIDFRYRLKDELDKYGERLTNPEDKLRPLIEKLSTSINEFSDSHNNSERDWVIQTAHTVSSFDEYMDSPTVVGLTTGLRDLDKKLGGLMPSEMSVFAARPAIGKSSIAAFIADHNVKNDKRVLFVNLEMEPLLLDFKRLSIQTGVPSWKYREKKLTAEEREYSAVVWETFQTQPLFYHSDPSSTVDTIRASVEFFAQRHGGIDLIVVDYLQLLAKDPNNLNNEIDLITKSLRAIAKSYEAHIMCLAQLSRGVEGRQDKRPVMSDLRSSGAIEQHADQIVGLYRDEYYNPDSMDSSITELIVQKNRNGSTGTVKVLHELDKSTYKDTLGL